MAPSVDVERIRVSAERHMYGILENEERALRDAFSPQDGQRRRRELVASSLALTESMAPEAYAAAQEAMARLGIRDEIELFQTSSGRVRDSVRLALYGKPIGVEFIGGYLESLDRGALLAVIGHEIGHAVAHSGHPKFAWVLDASQRATTGNLRAYAMAAEMTADRFGLLACRDLDAVLRLEMQGATGVGVTSIRFDTDAYLRQSRALAEDLIARGGVPFGLTHPEHHVRAYAEWLFTESDMYAELTGAGTGSRSIEEVDATVHKLLGIRVPAEPSPPGADESALDEILADDLRRRLAAAGNVLANVADALSPSIARLTDIARRRLASSQRAPVDEGPDLLEQERQELLARFEELEKRNQENDD